jgi:hypothetical protein
MNLIDKIDETHTRVRELKEKLHQAQLENNEKDIELFQDRVLTVAKERYLLKSLYVETICLTFGIELSDLMMTTGAELDLSKLRDEYQVVVQATIKT